MRARLSLLLLGLCSLSGAPPARVSDPGAPPPRITIILIDDMGWELYNRAITPHMDALMAGGVVFTQAWAYPACAPARAALLTGRHATRTGLGSNLNQPGEPGLAFGEVTLGELLPEAVDYIGKWHVSKRRTDPNTQGFSHYAGGLGNLNWGGYYKWKRTENGSIATEYRYATQVTTNDALNSSAGVRIVAYHAPHSPIQNPPGGTASSKAGKLLEMVAYLDREIGRLLENETGYVFLLADNGTALEFGGQKGTLFEGGLHVPFVAWGPGISPAISDDLVSIVDLYATVAELRGVASGAEDSISLVPILQGAPGTRTHNYCEMFGTNGDVSDREWTVRNRSWKLIHSFYPVPGDLLYRMPGEVPVPPPFSPGEQAAFDDLRANFPF
jgi:arylsulfatase A-like enzyme